MHCAFVRRAAAAAVAAAVAMAYSFPRCPSVKSGCRHVSSMLRLPVACINVIIKLLVRDGMWGVAQQPRVVRVGGWWSSRLSIVVGVCACPLMLRPPRWAVRGSTCDCAAVRSHMCALFWRRLIECLECFCESSLLAPETGQAPRRLLLSQEISLLSVPVPVWKRRVTNHLARSLGGG